jgi:hypothetical protein
VEEGYVNNVGYGQGRGHAACERHGQKDAVLQAAALRCTVARSVWGVAQRAGARASRDHRGDGDVWEHGRMGGWEGLQRRRFRFVHEQRGRTRSQRPRAFAMFRRRPEGGLRPCTHAHLPPACWVSSALPTTTASWRTTSRAPSP